MYTGILDNVDNDMKNIFFGMKKKNNLKEVGEDED